MKRRKLLKELAQLNVKLIRHGASHDIYGKGKKFIAVPRHTEIDEQLARDIIKSFSSMS